MANTGIRVAWEEPGWRSEAEAWIMARLSERGRRVAGPMDQPRVRPWSALLRVPTDAGDAWFKAVAPQFLYEAPMTAWLAQRFPNSTLPVWGMDANRGWLLLPDGGTRLREPFQADRNMQHWETLLAIYATMQCDAADAAEDLLAMGLPDFRLAQLPRLYAELLADTDFWELDTLSPDKDEPSLTTEEHTQLQALQGRVETLCARLAAFGLPETLDHGDLHDGNIFIANQENVPGYRFFDWGDASISHPFFSLRVVWANIAFSLKMEAAEGEPEWPELLDAYLDPWTSLLPRPELDSAHALARRLTWIPSALKWRRAGLAIPFFMRKFLAGEAEADATQ